MLNLQVDAYNDSLWNGNVNDATLECTCVGFLFFIFANWWKIRKYGFFIVNFYAELEWQYYLEHLQYQPMAAQ